LSFSLQNASVCMVLSARPSFVMTVELVERHDRRDEILGNLKLDQRVE
jgi:hypothetical protein